MLKRIFLEPLWKENVNIRVSTLLSIMVCSVKDTVCTCRVKHERELNNLELSKCGTKTQAFILLNGCRNVIFQ